MKYRCNACDRRTEAPLIEREDCPRGHGKKHQWVSRAEDDLMEAAAWAVETFGEDELERFARDANRIKQECVIP